MFLRKDVMTQTFFLIHTFSFATGFWWVCHQKGVEASKIFVSLIGGSLLGFAAMWGSKFYAHDSLLNHLPLFPLYALLGATTVLWFQARGNLIQQMSQDSAFLFTISFLYFLSPWQGVYRLMGMVATLPCLLVFLLSWRKSPPGTNARVAMMFWAMIMSLTIGIQQILLGPETLYPPKALSMAAGSVSLYWFNTSLQAAGFVTLALNVFPFIEWVQQSLGFGDLVAKDQVLSDRLSPKILFFVTFLHTAPLVLNWKYQFMTYSSMLDYSLVWSAFVSVKVAEFFFESENDDPKGWDHDIHQAS